MKKILVIEDNQCLRETTAEILQLANYKVVTAENGVLGVERAVQERPHLILCNVVMPHMNGYEVLQMLREKEAIRRVPFIFLSGHTERHYYRRGMELGADDFLARPYSVADLLKAVDIRLRKAESIQNEILEKQTTVLQPAMEHRQTLQSFLEGRTVQRYKKKQLIYQEGCRPQHLFYIKKGRVKVFKCNDGGRELAFAFYGEEDFFGYTGLLDGACYRESVEAMEVSEIIVIPRWEFQELIANNSELCRQFMHLLAKDVTEKEERLIGLAYSSLRKKVANALVTVSGKFGREAGSFGINISRENLANIAGTATESLIRMLSEFRSEKLIDITNGRIVILNKSGLREVK